MSHEGIQHTDPKLLGKILNAPEERDGWGTHDLAVMVRHQLAAPLVVDLERAFPGEGARVAAMAVSVVPAVISFGDLLRHPNPPVELLRLVKELCKASAEASKEVLPREVASYFYFASIQAARSRSEGGGRGGVSISTLPEERLREGLQWLLGQPWLEDSSRQILESLQGAG